MEGDEDGCDMAFFGLVENVVCYCILNYLKGFDGVGREAHAEVQF